MIPIGMRVVLVTVALTARYAPLVLVAAVALTIYAAAR